MKMFFVIRYDHELKYTLFLFSSDIVLTVRAEKGTVQVKVIVCMYTKGQQNGQLF